jgi:hypothetical protein
VKVASTNTAISTAANTPNSSAGQLLPRPLFFPLGETTIPPCSLGGEHVGQGRRVSPRVI